MRTLILFLSFVFLFGTVAAFAYQGNPDDRIHDEVMRKLASDPDIKGGGFTIDVKNGVVTIEGVVEKDKFKEKATHVAKKVKGVKSVDNKLVVKPRSS